MRNTFSRISALLTTTVILLGLGACSSKPSTVMVGEARPAINVNAVKLYLKEPTQYETVALLSVSSDGSWSFGDQAAKLGANGVLLQATGEKRDSSVYVGTGLGSYSGNLGLSVQLGRMFGLTDKTAEGVAIYVPAEESENSQ